MARPLKTGLEYFPFDVDFFSDIRIRKLVKYQGGKSISVYACLLCNIYKDGYYLVWDDELPFIISEQTGCEEAYIREVINICLNIGLFSKELFDTSKVLSSSGIQKRYDNISKLLKRRVVISEYTLVSSEETCINSEETWVNSEFSTQRESKGKEKVNNTPTPPKGDFPELSEKEKQLLDFEKQLKQKESELKAAQENASKPPRKPKKKDKVDTYLNSQAREIFENHVKVVFETDYYWTPKDAGNMSLLLQKLTFARKKKNFSLDDDSVLNALKVFLSTIKDGWLFENFTVAKINSQFNEIIAKAKNANKSTNQKEEQIRVGAGLTIL